MVVEIDKNMEIDCSFNLTGFAQGYVAVFLFEFAFNSILQ